MVAGGILVCLGHCEKFGFAERPRKESHTCGHALVVETVGYGDGEGHCWSGPVTQWERMKEIAQHMMVKMPEGTTTPWWKY